MTKSTAQSHLFQIRKEFASKNTIDAFEDVEIEGTHLATAREYLLSSCELILQHLVAVSGSR